MQELGFSRAARDSRTKSTKTNVIGLVVPQIGNTYFGRIAESVVAAADTHGFSVLMTSTLSNTRKQGEYVDLLADKDVAGIVYLGNTTSNRALSTLIKTGLPVVVLDEALIGTPPVDTVIVDDYAGAYQATAHLTSLGHERIALVTGPSGLASVAERRRGYADAMVRAGLDSEAQLHLSGAFSEDFGVGALSHILAAPSSPTAVFAASDTIALGIMTGAKNLGVQIPDDLSIAGFDDSPGASYVTPRLTTVRTPVDRMASNGLALLMERIEQRPAGVQRIVTPVALVVGESTAPLRAH
jgi:DNA-binding LacI/PurR family transcriptional regulator